MTDEKNKNKRDDDREMTDFEQSGDAPNEGRGLQTIDNAGGGDVKEPDPEWDRTGEGGGRGFASRANEERIQEKKKKMGEEEDTQTTKSLGV